MQPNQIEHYYFGTECKMDLGGGENECYILYAERSK